MCSLPQSDITLQEAADILNVSCSFLTHMLERGEIKTYQDVIAYKNRIDADRCKALDALTEQAQLLKMGY